MSRLDEIKARCDAATEGPWVRDMHSPDMSGRSGWYIRGPRKLGLRSMVLNSRMLSGDAEFVEAAREDVPWLIERVQELSGAICWDTTCLNCASLLDSNYDQYVRAEIAEAEIERLTDLCDEFRKREESQDRIRERLTAEVERLERWKAEATEVMSGLRELGKALGLRPGVQITGPAALAEVARLTAERDAMWAGTDPTPVEPGVTATDAQSLHHMLGQSPENRLNNFALMRHYAVVGADCAARGDEWEIAKLRAERDALAAQVAEGFHLTEVWASDLATDAMVNAMDGVAIEAINEQLKRLLDLRAALVGSEANTSDTQPTDQKVSDE